jgi:hypothetical protein
MSKKVEVTIKRSGKLTLTEINALTTKVLEDAQEIISVWNQSYETSFDFQRKVKALKTKHGILAAERAILFIATKHKKVTISVESADYKLALEKLHVEFKKANIATYKGSQVFEKVKNQLVLAQVENANIMGLAKSISLSLVRSR